MNRVAVSASKLFARSWIDTVAAALTHRQVGTPAIIEKKRARTRYVRAAERRRLLSRGGVAVSAVALAAWTGSLLGSGVLDPGARFNAERLAAQSGAQVVYGPAEVPGHPSATAQRQDLIRQFVALDGAN